MAAWRRHQAAFGYLRLSSLLLLSGMGGLRHIRAHIYTALACNCRRIYPRSARKLLLNQVQNL